MKRTVAVIGASPDRSKFGNKSVRAHAAAGFHVYPIHPTASEVEGWPAFSRLADVPVPALDRVTLYLPAAVALPLLDTLAAKPFNQLWLNPGADHPSVVARARELGFPVVVGCSIVDLGMEPSPD